MRGIIAGAVLALLSGCASAPQSAATGVAGASAPSNSFGIDLYTEVAPGEAGNILLSPASVSAAFVLAYAGAKGATADEIAEVFGFGEGAAFHQEEGARQRSLAIDADGRRVALANALWFDRKTVLERDFLDLVSKAYGAGAERADFRGAPSAARAEINQWAEARTDGRIKDLLSADDVTGATRLMLVNAIYLKADWAHEFSPEYTATNEFRLANGARVEVPFMRQIEFFSRLSKPGFEAILLPYVGGELSMAIFAPKGPGGIKAFEKRLTPAALAGWLQGLDDADTTSTDLMLPKARIEARYDLQGTMAALGLAEAFSDDADFSGMVVPEKQAADGGRGVKLGKVVHKTVLEMNEHGTEAAATTALEAVIVSGSRIAAPKPFRVDHPFFLVIRHEAGGAPVFIGRVMDPRGE